MDKFLLVINGETFRHGPQGSRERGTQESFKLQELASKSHLDFIKFLNKKFEVDCDVLLYNYKLNEEWDTHFKSQYQEYIKYSYSLDGLLGEQQLHSSLIKTIKDDVNIEDYKFLLFIRPDLYLKKYFLEIFDMCEDKIKFAHVNEITDHLGKSYHQIFEYPAVNHQIFYVPKKFFNNLLLGCLWRNHHSYPSSLNCGISKNQIDFFLKTYHSSCTSNTWNPIFHQVGRDETKFWVDKNYIIDEDTHTPKVVEYDGRYDNLKNNDFTDNFTI